jgi:acetyl-CoA C-acetyltransferase
MAQRVGIIGFGQTYHRSHRDDVNGVELINEAVRAALEDAGLSIDDIDAVVIGNMDHFEAVNYVDTWSVDGSGAWMKPLIKLTTGGTTGSTLGIAGYHHAASGLFDVVLVIGWEKNSESDTTGAIITCSDPIFDRFSFSGALPGLAVEASAYIKRYGIKEEDAARVAVRDRAHGANNPYAQLQTPVTVEEVMQSPMLSWPIKLLDICPRSDGAAAVIFAGERKARQLCSQPAWVHYTAVRHSHAYFGDVDYTRLHTLEAAVQELYQNVGIKEPLKELDVVELYQPYSFAGLKWIEAMGLCKPGESPRLVWDGVTDMGGELPFNPSGGVICTNCIGATGLLRIGEAALQVMDRAVGRQVPDVNLALATGFGGAYWSDLMLLGRRPR